MKKKRANQSEANAHKEDGLRGLLTYCGASCSTAGTLCAPVGSHLAGNQPYRVEAAPQLATAPAFMSGGRILNQTQLSSQSALNHRGVSETAAQTAVQTPHLAAEDDFSSSVVIGSGPFDSSQIALSANFNIVNNNIMNFLDLSATTDSLIFKLSILGKGLGLSDFVLSQFIVRCPKFKGTASTNQ